MPSNITIRLMHIGDLDQVHAIEMQSFSEPWSREAFERELTVNQAARYVVLEREGNIVAYGGLWLVMDEANITNIAVDNSLRRQGLGRILTEALLRLARCYDCISVTLEVRPSNEAARALYDSYGFQIVGVRPRYYSQPVEDALLMRKNNIDQISYDEEECGCVFGVVYE